jgi:hypothetical protein
VHASAPLSGSGARPITHAISPPSVVHPDVPARPAQFYPSEGAVELLVAKKAYGLTDTGGGGAAALRFALDHSDRSTTPIKVQSKAHMRYLAMLSARGCCRQGLVLQSSEAGFGFYQKMGFTGSKGDMKLDKDDFTGCGDNSPVNEDNNVTTEAKKCVIL